MRQIKEILQKGMLPMDGAFGTYYASLYGNAAPCELANIDHPDRVRTIHNEYIEAGARLLRSNTFAASRYHEGFTEAMSAEAIAAGYRILLDCVAGTGCFASADIGPLPDVDADGSDISREQRQAEYMRMADIFLDLGATIFVFETIADTNGLREAVEHIKKLSPDSFVLCQFAVRPEGYTRTGKGIESLAQELSHIPCDAVGMNCASGPSHMLRNMERLIRLTGKPVSMLPNAGHPYLLEGRVSYEQNSGYFAGIMQEAVNRGIKLPGGCCGTTPEYIRAMLQNEPRVVRIEKTHTRAKHPKAKLGTKPAIDIMVELNAPAGGTLDSTVRRSAELKALGVGTVTIPDSPLSRPRMNPLMVGELIRRKTGLETLVHMCCRDRNIIALQSDLTAAWALGLRRLLCVTGDPVAAGSRDETKSVFNLSSVSFMQMVSNMNRELFSSDPIEIYGAVKLNAPNFPAELARCAKKREAGTAAFLSQPVFGGAGIGNIKVLKEELGAKVYAGIMPPVSYRNAVFLKYEVPGMDIPEDVVARFAGIEDRDRAEGIGAQIAAEIINDAMQYADGIYLMLPFGRVSMAARLFQILNREVDRDEQAGI